jgi:hypothetical protein
MLQYAAAAARAIAVAAASQHCYVWQTFKYAAS